MQKFFDKFCLALEKEVADHKSELSAFFFSMERTLRTREEATVLYNQSRLNPTVLSPAP